MIEIYSLNTKVLTFHSPTNLKILPDQNHMRKSDFVNKKNLNLAKITFFLSDQFTKGKLQNISLILISIAIMATGSNSNGATVLENLSQFSAMDQSPQQPVRDKRPPQPKKKKKDAKEERVVLCCARSLSEDEADDNLNSMIEFDCKA